MSPHFETGVCACHPRGEGSMSILVLIGRILFVAVFLYSCVGHLRKTEAMALYARTRRVPAPKLATYIGGVVLLLGGVSVLFGAWADVGALLLAAFLLPTAVLMHGFWFERDGGRAIELTQFLKDIALCGAALMVAALISYAGHGLGLTLTGPFFHMR